MAEGIVEYGEGPVHLVGVVEFAHGQVVTADYYFADPFDPPEPRARWATTAGWPAEAQGRCVRFGVAAGGPVAVSPGRRPARGARVLLLDLGRRHLLAAPPAGQLAGQVPVAAVGAEPGVPPPDVSASASIAAIRVSKSAISVSNF